MAAYCLALYYLSQKAVAWMSSYKHCEGGDAELDRPVRVVGPPSIRRESIAVH